jgi:hypothetical protein
MEGCNLTTVPAVQHLTVEDVQELAGWKVPIEVFNKTWNLGPPNSLEPWDGTGAVPLGTWRFDEWCRTYEVLVEVDVSDLTIAEPEDGCKYRDDYRKYVEWAKEGREPPPIEVVRHVDGHLVSLNRRRTLAAREAGVKTLKAWYSETAPSGRARWCDSSL